MLNYTISMMYRINIKNNMNQTYTLCRVNLLGIFFSMKCAISCDKCHMPFRTILSRETIKLCLTIKKIEIINL